MNFFPARKPHSNGTMTMPGDERAAGKIARIQFEVLRGLLLEYVKFSPAFRSKPLGAPGSLARQGADYHIDLENRAIAAIALPLPPTNGANNEG